MLDTLYFCIDCNKIFFSENLMVHVVSLARMESVSTEIKLVACIKIHQERGKIPMALPAGKASVEFAPSRTDDVRCIYGSD